MKELVSISILNYNGLDYLKEIVLKFLIKRWKSR